MVLARPDELETCPYHFQFASLYNGHQVFMWSSCLLDLGADFLVTEVFEDLDKADADVVLLHGCPQSCMPNPVEGLLEVYEDMLQVLLTPSAQSLTQ